VAVGEGHPDCDGGWIEAVLHATRKAGIQPHKSLAQIQSATEKARHTREAKADRVREDREARLGVERPAREAQQALEREHTRKLARAMSRNDDALAIASSLSSRFSRSAVGTKRRAVQDAKDESLKRQVLERLGLTPPEVQYAHWDDATERVMRGRKGSGKA
jgi:hypothetical protein